MAATEKIEMRTCKTCGETKPLEGFNAVRNKGVKTYYYSLCKTCRNREVKQKRMEKRAAAEIIERASRSANIRAAHAACPILGIGLWTQSA